MTCARFPDACPNLRTVAPDLPHHEGGLRCGCDDLGPGARIPLDEMTSDQLDALYERVDTYRAAWHSARGRAAHQRCINADLRTELVAKTARTEQAEAAIERARGLASQWAVLRAYGGAATELRAALASLAAGVQRAARAEQDDFALTGEQPGPAATEATKETP
ncbi:hypothetical protein [Streptomyces sp. KL116D]|uniref:hypothetical protein n=1 Tax=Streptomyces sp. KL116D TaxID=3045152 RepID=UPI0035563DE7